MQILVAELAEFENGILRCLLVGGLRDMPFSDQVSLEGDEVVGVDLQVAADARLGLSAFGGHANEVSVVLIWY